MKLHNAFLLYDVMENRSAAEDLLLGILSAFPDDGQTIGAYYSVMAIMPQGYTLKRNAARSAALPVRMTLDQNFPNPFSAATVIPFSLASGSDVCLTVHDVLGRELRSIPLGYLPAGVHSHTINAGSFPPGMYFYSIRTSSGALTRRFMVAR